MSDQGECYDFGADDGPTTPTPRRRAESPPGSVLTEKCPICFESPKNLAFPNECRHAFCFTCLREWAAVKNCCPMCNRTFVNICFNIRGVDQYDTYHVIKPNVSHDARNIRIPRRRPAVSQFVNRLIRDTLAPAVGSSYTDQMRRSLFASPDNNSRRLERLRIYRHRFQAYFPDVSEQIAFRRSHPSVYRQNLVEFERMRAWITREIAILFARTNRQTDYIVDAICQLLTEVRIRDDGFKRRLLPYLSSDTPIFVSELYHYAISPYSIPEHDLFVQYRHPHLNRTASDWEERAPVAVIDLTTNDPQSSTSAVVVSENQTYDQEVLERFGIVRRLPPPPPVVSNANNDAVIVIDSSDSESESGHAFVEVQPSNEGEGQGDRSNANISLMSNESNESDCVLVGAEEAPIIQLEGESEEEEDDPNIPSTSTGIRNSTRIRKRRYSSDEEDNIHEITLDSDEERPLSSYAKRRTVIFRLPKRWNAEAESATRNYVEEDELFFGATTSDADAAETGNSTSTTSVSSTASSSDASSPELLSCGTIMEEGLHSLDAM